MKRLTDTYADRFNKRSLPELLVHKFLTKYGYANGPIIAEAIVDDILTVVEQCYPERLPPKTVVWLAVRREWKGQRKGIQLADLVPIRLPIATDEEIQLLMKPDLRKKLKARRAFNRARFARWCFEAYEQGGVLTLLDLSMLSGMSENYVGELLREYEAENEKVVPTRGTVHDLGPSVTHKAEVVRRWLRHESPAQIARVLGHSQEAVDRYIADFRKVRLLAQKVPIDEIPYLTGLSGSVVKQYLALIRQYDSALALYSESEQAAVSSGDIPVPTPARTTARGAGRVKGDRRESAAALDTGEHLATVGQVVEQAAC
jgi:hypothetical protein